jgi:hypothetical protein
MVMGAIATRAEDAGTATLHAEEEIENFKQKFHCTN